MLGIVLYSLLKQAYFSEVSSADRHQQALPVRILLMNSRDSLLVFFIPVDYNRSIEVLARSKFSANPYCVMSSS